MGTKRLFRRAGGGKLHSTEKSVELHKRDFVMIEINPKCVAGIEQRFKRGLRK